MKAFTWGALAGSAVTVAFGCVAMRIFDQIAMQQEFDASMNRIMGSIPDSQKADFRSPQEIARNPHPRSWQL